MPYAQFDGLRQYYERRGPPDGEPVVLIHGWMGTGATDWLNHPVCALLSARYDCIVPDCRGHGRSDNPTRDYHFTQLAQDVAGLIRALGLTRAHILGYSNGGNVAVVTLLEQAEVVHSAVLYAANAHLDDSIRAVSVRCQPEAQVQRRPEWCAELSELHSPVYGRDYWRDLMRWSATEIGQAPDYTPAELARARRPALVIQGEHDTTNQVGNHAQYIAAHVPDAALWIALGCGHRVHIEQPEAFTAHVLDFWQRHPLA